MYNRHVRIGIISDTHDHLENIDRAFELLAQENIEMVLHLGDWVAPYTVDHVATRAAKLKVPLKGVLGNNDGELFIIVSQNPAKWHIELGHHTLEVAAGERHIILYHGTDQNITNSLIMSSQYDAVFSGHTHEPRNEMVGKTLALNPGTLSGFSYTRGGIIPQGELAVYDTKAHQAQLIAFDI